MNSKITFQPARLQQQPQRPDNRQQQQSSGPGEFQPRRMWQVAQEFYPGAPESSSGPGAASQHGITAA